MLAVASRAQHVIVLAALAAQCRGPGTSASARPAGAGWGPFGLGRPATPAEINAWDDDVLPDGTGLPAGQGSVAAGEQIFATRCAPCHGAQGEGATALPLVSGEKPALGFRVGRSQRGEPRPTFVEFIPYATTLFDYTRRAMPANAPGSLRDDETYSLVGWMLHLNGLMSEDATVDKSSLLRVKMPALARFAYEDGERVPAQ